MNRIARSIMIAGALTMLVSTSSCKMPTGPEVRDFLDPPAEDIFYNGIVAYAGSVSLEFRIKPVDIAYVHTTQDTCWVRLDASTDSYSTASYYLHARPYHGEFRDANTKAILRNVTLTPDNIPDERVYQTMTMLDWVYDYHAKRFAP